MKLTAKTTTYEFSPEDIQSLIAESISAKVEDICVDYVIQEVGGDPLDRYPGTDTVTKIRVTVQTK